MPANRLALGTVQFGLPYGVANRQGQVPETEAREILKLAQAQGIDTLDTAIAYGTSEACLGAIGMQGWRIITKLPGLPAGQIDVTQWVQEQVAASMQCLRVHHLQGLLLHRSSDLFSSQGQPLYQALIHLKAQGLVDKIGVSIYDPDELPQLLAHYPIDLVQAPYNVLDRRLTDSGWLDHLFSRGIAVHARSVFLQGLLLMPVHDRPQAFNRWQPLWRRWHDWLRDTGQTPLQACLGFALAQSSIERVLVGVDSLSQFGEILAATAMPYCQPPADLCNDDPDLINPSRWQLRS